MEITKHIALADIAHITQHGFAVQYEGRNYWTLTHDDGCGNGPSYCMIGENGCVSSTKWEAVAEAQKRIAQDEETHIYLEQKRTAS